MVERRGDIPANAAGDELDVAKAGLHLIEVRLRAVVRIGCKVRATVVQRLRNDGELKALRRMRVLFVAEVFPPSAAHDRALADLVREPETRTDVVPIVRAVGGIERSQADVVGERARFSVVSKPEIERQ